MPERCLFNISLFMILLSAIETLIFHTEIDFDRVYFLWFLRKVRYMIFKSTLVTHSSIVFDKCHKNEMIQFEMSFNFCTVYSRQLLGL